MKQVISIVIIINLLPLAASQASSVSSEEIALLGQIAIAIQAYPNLYNGQQMTSWTQAREELNLDVANRRLRDVEAAAYPLEDHYEFITPHVLFPGYEESQVLLIRTVPLQRAEGQPQFRYMIVRSRDGKVVPTRLPEEQVQAMFLKAGVSLPVPKPGLPAVQIEEMPSTEEIYGFASPAATASASQSSSPKATQIQTKLPPSAPGPVASPTPTAKVTEKKYPTSFPIVFIVIVGIIIMGGIVFFMRRKNP